MFKWFDKHPMTVIITYTILIASSVFAYSKFVLIENSENEYKAQLETKDAIVLQRDAVIQQYEARIAFLETENNRLHDDVNRYQEWLQNTPNTLQHIEQENERLKSQLETTINQIQAMPPTIEQKYSRSYELIKENTAIIDEYTGIVVALNDISVTYKGVLSITVPNTDTMTIKDVSAGFTQEYIVNDVKYQLILTLIDYISNKYSFAIRQP